MQDLKIRMGREIPNSDQVINELDELQPGRSHIELFASQQTEPPPDTCP